MFRRPERGAGYVDNSACNASDAFDADARSFCRCSRRPRRRDVLNYLSKSAAPRLAVAATVGNLDRPRPRRRSGQNAVATVPAAAADVYAVSSWEFLAT